MCGYSGMLLRLFLLLMISIPSMAFSCEKTIEAIKLMELNYVTDLKLPLKKSFKLILSQKFYLGVT